MLRHYKGTEQTLTTQALLNWGAAVLRPYLEFTNPLEGKEIL